MQVVDSYNYSKYGATTCVCIAFKMFEMQQIILDMGKLDPNIDTLAML